MCNRHGLIAGATGTGKTKTLQLMAEQLSAMGVPVFAADIKGDLSGLAATGRAQRQGGATGRRSSAIEWAPSGHPVTFLSLGGLGPGVPVRAAVSSFGPQLLAKVLGANETQSSSLSLVFDYADKRRPRRSLDLDDLRAVLQYLIGDDGKAELERHRRPVVGDRRRAAAQDRRARAAGRRGVLRRARARHRRPDPDHDRREGRHQLPRARRGAGQAQACSPRSSCGCSPTCSRRCPRSATSTSPSSCFFFDEAHLLFDDAPKEFVAQVAQTVRLIRSKGVGVFFVTQLPDDVPDDVLAQLGQPRPARAPRVHARATPRRSRPRSRPIPNTDDYDLEEDLTQLGIGEAMVTILSERGAPTPVVWTRLLHRRRSWPRWHRTRSTACREGELHLGQVRGAHRSRVSTREADRQDGSVGHRRATGAAPPPTPRKRRGGARAGAKTKSRGKTERAPQPDDGNAVTDFLGSREGRATVNNVVRGAFGVLKGFMK